MVCLDGGECRVGSSLSAQMVGMPDTIFIVCADDGTIRVRVMVFPDEGHDGYGLMPAKWSWLIRPNYMRDWRNQKARQATRTKDT